MLGKELVLGLHEGNGTTVPYQLYSITAEEDETQTEEKEQILLRKLAQGDSTTFWSLWVRYQDYLYSYCL
ncbi:hypothetical protein H8E77_24425 [bacterium]|nr:hypothetical protein [bacterium]